MNKVDIISCVSDPLLIEEEVFNLWISGIPGTVALVICFL